MSELAVILAAVAVIISYLGWLRAGARDRQLEEVRAELAQMQKELSETRARLEADLKQIRQGLRPNTGRPEFRPDMTIAEAMEVHPGVRGVLASYQLTGCSDCAVSDVDTLEGACRSYGLDLSKLMKALAALGGPATEGGAATTASAYSQN